MLDKNIKDYDADVELLQDRKKQSLLFFLFFYIGGLILLMVGLILPSFAWDDLFFASGIGGLVIGGYFLTIYLNYTNLIFFRLNLLKEKK